MQHILSLLQSLLVPATMIIPGTTTHMTTARVRLLIVVRKRRMKRMTTVKKSTILV
jgi:hypothetical protein